MNMNLNVLFVKTLHKVYLKRTSATRWQHFSKEVAVVYNYF